MNTDILNMIHLFTTGLALQQSSQLGPIILAMLEIKGLLEIFLILLLEMTSVHRLYHDNYVLYHTKRVKSPCHRAIMRDE